MDDTQGAAEQRFEIRTQYQQHSQPSTDNKVASSHAISAIQQNPKTLGEFKRGSQEIQNIDAELEELLKRQRATIKVVGCGGGGN
ncbi:MAG: hypothetical protein AABX98_01210, partial [Nanoarchaeota archaeon]